MARIAGINIPDNKHARIALTYIYGIGLTTAEKICVGAGVDPTTKVGSLDEANLDAIRSEVCEGHGGRRLASRDVHEHQAIDGPGLLSGDTSSTALAGARTENKNQCAHP